MTVVYEDPYRVLGVARDADQATIRRAYRALAKTYHPDVNAGDATAEDMFKKIGLAYDILGDADKRARFNRGEIGPDGAERHGFPGGGHAGDRHAGGFAEADQGFSETDGPFTFRWSSHGPGEPGGPAGMDDPAFSDLFADLFGQRTRDAGRPRSGAAGRGADLRLRLTVTFEEAALGAKKTLRLGDGKTITVSIPAGIEDGHRLRLKGKGRPGLGGGPAGDALIAVSVAPHPLFRRDGLDIHVDVSVPLAEAVLGGKVTIPTPAGPVSLTVPANSSSGRKLRLKGRGIHKGGHKGNLYARLMIALPDPPDPELAALLRRQAKKAPGSTQNR